MIQNGIRSEVVSKYIGHSRIDTTLENYWICNIQELFDSINSHNPLQNKINTDEEIVDEMDKLWNKITESLKLNRILYLMIQNATDLSTLQQKLRDTIPDIEVVERAIIQSTISGSVSCQSTV